MNFYQSLSYSLLLLAVSCGTQYAATDISIYDQSTVVQCLLDRNKRVITSALSTLYPIDAGMFAIFAAASKLVLVLAVRARLQH